jgi:hypothetical protein
MKKKSIFEKGKTLLKATALTAAIGATAIGCDVLGHDESEEDKALSNDDWKTNPNAIEPHTGVSCNEIAFEMGLPYNESVKRFCEVEVLIEDILNKKPDERVGYDRCFNKYTNIFNDDTLLIKTSALDRLATKKCVEKFKNGEFVRNGSGEKVNKVEDCIKHGNPAFASCTWNYNDKPSQYEICKENFGI